MTADLFTPWQESRAALEERTVARSGVLGALDLTLARFARGERPLATWIAGPRGIGKSHVLAIANARARALGLETSFLSEEAPPCATAEALFERMRYGERWAARTWGGATLAPGPRVLFVEGFDRQLRALKESGARTLRRLFAEHPVLIVASDVEVGPLVTAADAPFFGQFDVWRLEALDDAQAMQLVHGVLGDQLPPAAEARSRALVHLGAGQPRVLLALAQALGRSEPSDVATALGRVVSALVPHYQMRLRDLSPEGQQVVEALALAPRGLQPSELELANPSKVLGRLRGDGLVRAVPFGDDGRKSWYELTDPLLRHVVEFRSTTRWEDSRAAGVSRLLGEVLTRDELAHVWWSAPDTELLRVPGVREEVSSRLRSEVEAATTPEERRALVQRALAVEPDELPFYLVYCLEDPVWDWLRDASAADRALAAFVRDAPGSPRAATETLARELSGARQAWGRWGWVWASFVVRGALDRARPQGAPWTRRIPGLCELPVLRARFLVEGRRAGDPGIVRPAELTLKASDLDLEEVANAAHQLQDAGLWRSALERGAPLGWCFRPGLAPVDVDGFAAAFERSSDLWVVRWSAGLAEVGEPGFDRCLARLAAGVWLDDQDEGHVVALGALAVRAPERWARVASLPSLSAGKGAVLREKVERIRRFVAEGERGPLHAELARVAERLRRPAA